MTRFFNTRRNILTGLLAFLGNTAMGPKANAAITTPRATEGPFYPDPSMRRPDTDNDLVKIAGLVARAGGSAFTLRGRITDRKGMPRSGYRIEIWQTDMNGKYLHPGDNRDGAHDQGFQGFGHDVTDSRGRYSFRTIKPGKYPGRTPHIHVKIFDDQGRERLTTQFYEAGNSGNKRDSLFRAMSKKQADSVSMFYANGPDGEIAEVNVII